jgi:hypothetical protein
MKDSLGCVPAKAVLHQNDQVRLQHRERAGIEKTGQQEPAQIRHSKHVAQRFERIQVTQADRGHTKLFTQALRQEEEAPGDIEQDDPGSDDKWRAVVDIRQQAADAGADDEASARDSAHHTKVLAALLWLSDIRDIGQEHAKVAAGQAIDDTAQEEDPERATQAKEQVTDRRAQQADEQDRAPAKAIAEPPQARGRDKLADAKDRDQPGHHDGEIVRIAQVLTGHKRHYRIDDGHAHGI